MTAHPIQRLLGLTTVRVGTGTASTSGEDQLDLDGLPVERARQLRADLLHVAPVDAEEPAAEETGPAPTKVVLRLDPGWARFAPLTSSGFIAAAAIIGVGSQLFDSVGGGPGVQVDD